jgi:hypothetical protein
MIASLPNYIKQSSPAAFGALMSALKGVFLQHISARAETDPENQAFAHIKL